MPTRLNPYLSFTGNAREAMEFYKTVFGGELAITTFGEGGGTTDPAAKDQVMHAQLEAPNGYWLMGSDTPPGMDPTSNSTTISLSGDDEAQLRGYWDKLSAGGTLTLPLEQAPWGDSFGALTDRFGVAWVVNITSAGNA